MSTTEEFIKYVGRYEATFQQYGYFAEAVREVNPQLVFTTGSYGVLPAPGGVVAVGDGSGAHDVLGLSTQQAVRLEYLHAAKPMHKSRSRIGSQLSPKKTTWALIDNFRLPLWPRGVQRAYGSR